MHPQRLTPARPWAPLSDDEWAALLPYVLKQAPQGRPTLSDLRHRMNGIFRMACTSGQPWKDLPEDYGKPNTVARFFRRLTHAGLWQRLLRALAGDALLPAHPLRRVEHFVCRAARRAARLGGMPLLLLIRRLGLRSALNGMPCLQYDPLLSQTLGHALLAAALRPPPATPRERRAREDHLRTLRRAFRDVCGAAPQTKAMRWAWP